MPIRVISTIKPKNDGYFPVVEDSDIYGGYHTVYDITERNNIPFERIKAGMAVFVVSEWKLYIYDENLSEWVEFSQPINNRELIYQPLGVANSNIYNNWSDLMTAKSLINGPVTIYIDLTYLNHNDNPYGAEIPSGEWDMTNVILDSFNVENNPSSSFLTSVKILDGCILNNLHFIRNLSITLEPQSIHNSSINLNNYPWSLHMENSSLQRHDGTTNSGPIVFDEEAHPYYLYLNNSFLQKYNVMNPDDGPIIECYPFVDLTINCINGSIINEYTVSSFAP